MVILLYSTKKKKEICEIQTVKIHPDISLFSNLK